jgi:hypothetical protein
VGGTKEGGDNGGSSRKRNKVKPRDRQADENGVANMEKWHASIATIVFFFEKEVEAPSLYIEVMHTDFLFIYSTKSGKRFTTNIQNEAAKQGENITY